MIAFHAADVMIPLKQRLLVRSWLARIAESRGYRVDALSYVFCSDDFLLDMNKRYLQHDYYTDIITFPLGDGSKGVVNAECYISIDRVRENAKQNHVTFALEMRRVMVHGLLHLTGEDDKTDADEKSMRAAEDAALMEWLFHVEQQNKTK